MARPRYSIIPGDFATDSRADVAHFRVLNHLGSHTDGDGWCRLKQVTIGDACGMTRETVNRKLRDLVEWGYVERHAEDATGRAIWYRVLMDRHRPQPVPATDAADEPDLFETHSSERGCGPAHEASENERTGPVRHGSHVGYNADEELHPTCDPTDHTRCDRIRAQQERPFFNDQVKSPLPPQAGEKCGEVFSVSGSPADNLSGGSMTGDADAGYLADGPPDSLSAGAGQALRKLAADRPHDPAVVRLLTPLLAKRRFSAADPAAALAGACGKARGLSPAHLDKVLEILLAADVKVVKAERLFAAIDAVRKGGLMLVIARGQPEFAAWLRHYEQTLPNMAALMAREGKWQVPSRFPPAAAGQLGEVTP